MIKNLKFKCDPSQNTLSLTLSKYDTVDKDYTSYNNKFVKKFVYRGFEIWKNDILVSKTKLVAGVLIEDIVDKNLYGEYIDWIHEMRIIKFLEEERYSNISEELILMGLPSGKPFGQLEDHPLWKNYAEWYKEFQKKLICEQTGRPYNDDNC